VLDLLDAYLAGNPSFIDGIVPYALARLGQPQRAMQLTETHRLSHPMYLALLWGPYGKETRTRPDFTEFARKIGFTAVWDTYGAPDLCRKTADGGYLCE